MVFSSMHPYLDPAHWPQQQQPTHQIGSSSGPGSQLLPPPPPPLPPTQSHGASGSGSIRPGSMADRARMANISMPEVALKCPRCDSTNTKFCYFNNYSLSQPRHFCKTCRRYWTRGGAMRNVPVGGGCRRNKRNKGSSSKSPQVSSDRQTGSATSTNSVSSNSASAADMVDLSPQLSSLKFSAPALHQLTEFGSGEMGLNYGNLSNQMGGVGDLSFHLGTVLAGGASSSGSSILSAAGLEQWRMSQTQQFPFLTGLEASPYLYQFQSGAAVPGYGGGSSHQLRPQVPSGMITRVASVKMEDHNHHQELNLSRHFLGMNNNSTNHEQYWNTTAGNSNSTAANWTELSGFRSSTTSNNPP